ncbi:MAG: hypothetical protein EA368_07345 [Leptolyngbya sp. DLM2.Bin27]|nr:MAG: hypothetical protein EA368_07345 [Leptolyngbya sp. DLM2.Bin27]
MLSRQRRSESQPGEPIADSLAPQFHLVIDGADSALALPEVMPPTPAGGNQSWRLLVISLLSCFAASGAAVGAFLWLINLPPTANCEQTATNSTDRARLFCAQVAAESGELTDVLAALDLVNAWPADHPLHYEVQPLVDQWSWVVLQAADQELRSNGTMAEAQSLVSHIPADSSVFATAQSTMALWQGEWAQGEAIMATAQEALKQKDWPAASKQVQALAELENSHWRVSQVQALARQIRQERQAQDLIDRAVATAAPGGSDRLAAALGIASQIDEGTYARQQAQPYLNRWSDLLLTLGLDKWYASDLDTAIALGRSAALNPSRAQVAQELIWLSESRQTAQQSLIGWRTSPDQVVKLYQAMMTANRVPKSSPYYPQAQSGVATWRQHLGDLAQFQVAQAVGQVRDRNALQAAIAQAAAVPLGHPRRVQAQTMVAHWRQEIERLEDRPYLVKAHQLASTKTRAGLQAAIQTAQGVALPRALRGEAQSWIYIWTSEIQVMEDRPILNRARSLAAAGNLSQAIVEASGIGSGRTLYGEARAAIAGWQQDIVAAEQARQQARQRAAVRQAAAAVADLEPAETTDNLPPVEAEPPPLAPAPAPARPSLRQSPRPNRIETIPGAPAPTPALTPAPTPAPAPGAAVTPAPLRLPEPSAAPAPIDIAPPAPTPVAAPSPLLAPEVTAPRSIDLAPEPAVAPPPLGPQSARPPAPPGPTQLRPKTAIGLRLPSPVAHTEVLATGALYIGG